MKHLLRPGPDRPAAILLLAGAVASLVAAVLAAVPSHGRAAPGKASASSRAPAATSPGATLATDLPCYLPHHSLAVSGAGFAPAARYVVTLDGARQGSGSTSAAGRIAGRLDSGVLPSSAIDVRHTVTVAAGSTSASASFLVTHFAASFYPDTGDPATLRVRYTLLGFGLGPAQRGDPAHDPTPRRLYLHYVDPSGHERDLVSLGRTHGVCGSLPLTRRHHLFAFTPTPGTWRLQFDTHRRYSPTRVPRVVRAVVVR
jgi:hypothetical protein